jgi:hypothetical protein
MTNTKATGRVTLNMSPRAVTMLDELVERSGLDRPAVLAIIVQTFYDKPTSLFTPPRSDKCADALEQAA